MTLTRRSIAELLATHGLEPSRALGQNFVVDPNTVRRIARLSGVGPGDHVVEVGPGLGSLTLALAETGATVTAVEVDQHLLPVLRSVLDARGVLADGEGQTAGRAGRVRVVRADATKADWDQILQGAARWTLVANLPYNVATPLLIDLLERVPRIDRFFVMVQEEVAERLVAAPGDKIYGIPSVKVAFHGSARIAGRVGSDVFLPRPRVGSALVEIVRHTSVPPVRDREGLFHLVRTAFGQRRKMLRRSLAGTVGPEAFASAGIDPSSRPEQLDLAAWIRLADACAARDHT